MPIVEFAQEKKKRRPTDGEFEFFFFGGADGDRTHDLSIANAALSQLSYGPTRGGYYHYL